MVSVFHLWTKCVRDGERCQGTDSWWFLNSTYRRPSFCWGCSKINRFLKQALLGVRIIDLRITRLPILISRLVAAGKVSLSFAQKSGRFTARLFPCQNFSTHFRTSLLEHVSYDSAILLLIIYPPISDILTLYSSSASFQEWMRRESSHTSEWLLAMLLLDGFKRTISRYKKLLSG